MTDNSQEHIALYHHEQVPLSNNNASSTTMILSDLENIIYNYQTQPELLKIILSSKLEEDKRKAEEARLKAKTLDLLILQQQQQATFYPSYTFSDTNYVSPEESALVFHPTQHITTQQYNEAYDSLLSPAYTCSSDELDDVSLFQSYPTTTTTTTTTTATASLEKEVDYEFNNSKEVIFDGNVQTQKQYEFQHYDILFQEDMMSKNNNSSSMIRTKRKREMQAITEIVETKEYPYLDGYFWKNNGNTIQKKTGNKSIYYKCSNNNKGCSVNKTVTWKGNGDYLIKYRGEHLITCNKVKLYNSGT